MTKVIISPPSMSTPTGYSYAIKKGGQPLYIAGQVPLDGQGNLVGPGDVTAQAEQVYRNIQTVVEAAGGTLNDIVKVTVFTTDIAHRPALGAVRQSFFKDGPYPASTFLVIASLANPAFLIEIEAVALIGD